MGQAIEQPPRGAAAQLALLEELKGLAIQLGFEVRQERLLREVGYRVRSGSCRVRGTRIILLERTLSASNQIDILVDELAGQRLEDIYLTPVARRLLDRAGDTPAMPAAVAEGLAR